MQTYLEVDQIQTTSESIRQEITAHRADHAQSHARIIEVQERQQQLAAKMRHVHTEQKETNKELTKTGK
jgi:hypothetical protein